MPAPVTSPALFEVEFDYAFEDYREAYAAQQRSLLPPGAVWKTFGGWIAFLLLGAFLYLMLRWPLRGAGGAAIRPPTAAPPIVVVLRLLLGLALSLLSLVSVAVVIARGPRGRTYKPPVEHFIRARGPVVSGAVSVALVLASLLFGGAMLAQPRGVGGASMADALEAVWPYALGVGVVIGLLIWAGQKQIVRNMWEGQPALRVRKHLVVRDDGFSIGDVSSVTQTKWIAVKRFIETPALFLLMLGDYTFHMVPKRALGDPPRAADEFRTLLRMKVQAPTGAFPVMSAASAAPLPMPPLQPRDDSAAG
jgi:hypothetical protein